MQEKTNLQKTLNTITTNEISLDAPSGLCTRKPDISYPCSWEYKIILDKSTNAKSLLDGILKDKYTLKISKTTTSYTSYNISMQVASEQHRLEVFDLLRKHSKYVL